MLKRLARRALVAALLSLWALLTLTLAWPALAGWLDRPRAPRAPAAGGSNYLIIVPQALAGSAETWAEYRRARGYAVQVATIAPHDATVETIQATVRRVYVESGRPSPFYLLLLGQAHAFLPESYLPAGRVPLDLPPELLEAVGSDHVASDDVYALDEAGGPLPIAVGRVPATSDADALRVLTRTRQYETNPPPGAGRTRVELLASESNFGPAFDQAIEALLIYFVETHLPDDYRWHLLYGHPGSPYNYPVADFPHEAARRLDAGALLVAYIGHGSGDWLGPAASATGERGRVFDLGDVAEVTGAEASIVMMLACSAGEYDQDWSLAEQLLLQPGGPVATYAASRVSLPAGNTILGKDLFRGLLERKAPTAGEWLRLAESNYRNPGSDRAFSLWLLSRAIPPLYDRAIRGNDNETPPIDAETVYGLQQHAYNLFGDPALALATARPELVVRPASIWHPFPGRVAFTGSGASAGEAVMVTLYTSQAAILPRTAQANDLAARYREANDKTVAVLRITAGDRGEFSGELALPPGLPAGQYILHAVSVGQGVTRVGSQAVYLGWAPLAAMLSSNLSWWLLASTLCVGWLRQAMAGPETRRSPRVRR